MARTIGNWVMDPVPIGSGSFAIVWKATEVPSGRLAAVKEINTEKLSPKLQESLASEINVLERTKHKNIVGMLDLIQEPGRMFLVLEFCGGGDLGQYLRRYGRVSENTARYFMHQLSEGLRELRMHNVLHRDLKPQNLLLSDTSRQPTLKIADFGFARSLHPQGMAETLCGSPLYMAPEILQSNKYDAKADLWSVGTILHELLTGRPPFNGANHIQLLQNIERHEPRLPETLPPHLSPTCRQLIARLLRRNPAQRMDFDEFFQHPFFQGGADPQATLTLAPSPFVSPQARQRAAAAAGGGDAFMEVQQQAAVGQQQRIGKPVSAPTAGSSGSGSGSGSAGSREAHNAATISGRTPAGVAAAQAAGMDTVPVQTSGGSLGEVSLRISHPLQASSEGTASKEGEHDLDGDSSDGEYVVVSGRSSPNSAAQGGSAGHHSRQHRQHHHSKHQRQISRVQSGAVATMAAVAAAACQAVATVARSVQHPHNASRQATKGTFFHSPSPTSSQIMSPGTLAHRRTVSGTGAAPAAILACHSPATSSPCSDGLHHPGEAAILAGRQQQQQAGMHVDAATLANQIRLPEHLDTSDLLQRVILLLTESARGRAEAATASELAAEEAEGAGEGPALGPGPAADWQQEQQQRRQRQAQEAAGATPGQLLSLYLYSCRLLEAGMMSAMGPAAALLPLQADSAAVSAAAHVTATGAPAPVEAQPGVSIQQQTGGVASPSSEAQPGEGNEASHCDGAAPGSTQPGASASASPVAGAAAPAAAAASSSDVLHRMPADIRQLMPLKLRAKFLLSCLDGRLLLDLKSQAKAQGQAPVPAGPDIVLDSALRYSRAAAADELLGLFPSSVEGYARAADLLLFLLTDLPGMPHDVKPTLQAQDQQRVYRYYAAVKLRQATCMAALNAQLRAR